MKTKKPLKSKKTTKAFVHNSDSFSSEEKASHRLSRPYTDLKAVSSILSPLLRKHGLENKIEEYQFVLKWREIVGENISRISKPECIKKDTLIVRVSNSGWAQELSFLKGELLQKLKTVLPFNSNIKDLKFYVGDLAK